MYPAQSGKEDFRKPLFHFAVRFLENEREVEGKVTQGVGSDGRCRVSALPLSPPVQVPSLASACKPGGGAEGGALMPAAPALTAPSAPGGCDGGGDAEMATSSVDQPGVEPEPQAHAERGLVEAAEPPRAALERRADSDQLEVEMVEAGSEPHPAGEGGGVELMEGPPLDLGPPGGKKRGVHDLGAKGAVKKKGREGAVAKAGGIRTLSVPEDPGTGGPATNTRSHSAALVGDPIPSLDPSPKMLTPANSSLDRLPEHGSLVGDIAPDIGGLRL